MSACHKENAATNKPCKEERLPREVIENKLLARLSDKGSVAILLNEEDLDALISWLVIANGFDTPADYGKCRAFVQDLRQLRKGAFGK